METFEFISEVPYNFHGQCYIKQLFRNIPATVWYEHGLQHREDGPAIICENGCWFWRFKDKGHRLDGPTAYWSPDCGYGDREGKYYYYLFEVEYSEEEYWAHPLVMKNKLERIVCL